MNSGAPASIAPPESASAGRIVSQRVCNVLYALRSKNFGVYAPDSAPAFSASIMPWACSAAASGMTRRTEAATAPMLSDFRIARLVTWSVDIGFALQRSFFGLVEKIIGCSPRERHDGERRVLVGIGDERCRIGDEEILDVVSLAVRIQRRGLRVAAHAHGSQFMNDCATLGNACLGLPSCLAGLRMAARAA